MLPRPVPIGWGNIHDLFAGPDLEHLGYAMESRVDDFPVYCVELFCEEDVGLVESG